jgi:hypothetical protein
MKPSHLKLLENLYNFLGANEDLLKSEFKKIKKSKQKEKFNFQQFCVTIYSIQDENSTTTKSSK